MKVGTCVLHPLRWILHDKLLSPFFKSWYITRTLGGCRLPIALSLAPFGPSNVPQLLPSVPPCLPPSLPPILTPFLPNTKVVLASRKADLSR